MPPRHPCIEQITIINGEGVDILDKNIDLGGCFNCGEVEKELAMEQFLDWWEKNLASILSWSRSKDTLSLFFTYLLEIKK